MNSSAYTTFKQIETGASRSKGLALTDEITNLEEIMNTFYQYMKDTYTIEELQEIAEHGCVSGCATTLIYYRDTCALYDLHAEELHTKLGEWIEEIGENPSFITDQLGFSNGFQNAMVWFVAEQYANELIQTAEAA